MGYSLYDDTQYKCTWDTHTLGTNIRMGYSLDTLIIMAYDDTTQLHMGYI